MRSDLNKVLCERPRVGHQNRFNRVRHDKKFNARDPEMNVSRESMTIRHRVTHTWKTFNEHLNPLFGIVRKNVGRPWNKVYSEICKVFDKRSVINQHILGHLQDYVNTNVVYKDGQLWSNEPGHWMYGPLKQCTYIEYYVDPRSGLLVRNKYFKYYKQEARERRKLYLQQQAAKVRIVDDMTELHKVDGVWYKFEFAPLPEPTTRVIIDPVTLLERQIVDSNAVRDVLEQTMKSRVRSKETRYAKTKTQLCHQQLKQYGLENDLKEKRK